VQIAIEDLGSCKKKLKIEIPAEKVTEELDKRTRELKDSAELPGFRRGHIPARLFEKRFGKKLREAVRNDLSAEVYEEALKEHKLEPLSEPEFPGLEDMDIERETPFAFEVDLFVKPQVKVEDYVGIEVKAEELDVTDDEVENAIEQVRRERAELVVVEDRISEEEDMLMVDVEVTVEGQSLHSSQGSYVGVGSKGVFGVEIEGLTEKLKGHKAGDSVEFEFELPKTSALEYGEELAGKMAKCALKVNEVKTLNIPEATDEWAKEVGFESIADMREKVREQVKAGKERGRDRFVEQRILDKLLESTGFDVPTEMIEAKAHEVTEYRRFQLIKAGVESEKIDTDLDSYRDLSRKELEKNFKEDLILNKIAELENIFVTEDEVDSAIAQIALSKGQMPDAFREEMDERGLTSRLRSELLESRVKEYLRKKAKLELVPAGTLGEDVKKEEPEEVAEEEKPAESQDKAEE
jgi:trigger factor